MQRGEVDAFDIDCVASVELFLAHLQCGAVTVGPAGIAHHDIQAAMALHGCGHQGLHGGRPGHIGGKKRCSTATGPDRLSHQLTTLSVDVVDDDSRPLLGQASGNTFANAVPGASDDDGFVLDSHV
jgi:hypothetical protein